MSALAKAVFCSCSSFLRELCVPRLDEVLGPDVDEAVVVLVGVQQVDPDVLLRVVRSQVFELLVDLRSLVCLALLELLGLAGRHGDLAHGLVFEQREVAEVVHLDLLALFELEVVERVVEYDGHVSVVEVLEEGVAYDLGGALELLAVDVDEAGFLLAAFLLLLLPFLLQFDQLLLVGVRVFFVRLVFLGEWGVRFFRGARGARLQLFAVPFCFCFCFWPFFPR